MRAEFGCAGNNLSRRLCLFWGASPTARVAPGETYGTAAVVLFWWAQGAPLQWMKAWKYFWWWWFFIWAVPVGALGVSFKTPTVFWLVWGVGRPLLVALLICYFGKNAPTSQSGFFYHLKTPRSGFASITAPPSADSACADMLITGDFASVSETMLEGVWDGLVQKLRLGREGSGQMKQWKCPVLVSLQNVRGGEGGGKHRFQVREICCLGHGKYCKQ